MTSDGVLGQAHRALAGGDIERGSALLRRALMAAPDHAPALYLMGRAELQRGGAAGLAADFLTRSVMALNRGLVEALAGEVFLALGLALRSSGNRGGARAYRRSLLVDPANTQARFNLSNAALDDRKPVAAARLCRQTVIARPDWADGWNNLGRTMIDENRSVRAAISDSDPARDFAGAALRRALVLSPAHRFAANNLGVSHKRLDRVPDAIRQFTHAVCLEPTSVAAQANLGRNLLMSGDLERGWRALEFEKRQTGFTPASGGFSVPVWDGAPIPDGELLIWSEEKVGDDILFAGLLPDLARLAGRLRLLAPPRLVALFRRSLPATISVTPYDGKHAPDCDMSQVRAGYLLEFVGLFVRHSPADFPPPNPYLLVDDALAEPYRAARIPGEMRVGVAWHSINSLIGDYKSQRLADWAEILTIPGLRFYSLQYGDNSAELDEVERATGIRVETPAGIDQMQDLESFAALVSSMDLVISIPNTTAHVAGAIGTPCWVMLPTGPGLSWFWFQESEHTVWYRDMSLFRQVEVGVWAPVVKRVARALSQFKG